MAKLLVFGSNGLLGASLAPWLRAAGHEVVEQGRKPTAGLQLDPLDAQAVAAALKRLRPDGLVNLIAATDVDRCETDPAEAQAANVRAVQAIAEGMRVAGVERLVHISTDQVYDGAGPHAEAQARPCNVYARTKLEGERIAAAAGATVLRTNFVGRSRCAGRTSLSDWIVNSLRAGRRITVFEDVLFGPLHIQTLCRLIGQAAERPVPGVFNAGCSDGMSKADFAFALAGRLGLDRGLMTAGVSSAMAFKARRPLDMRMDTRLAQRELGFDPPSVAHETQLTAEEYEHAA